MPNQHETTITNHLVNILRNMRRGWEVETAVQAFIKGNTEMDLMKQQENTKEFPLNQLIVWGLGTTVGIAVGDFTG